MKIYFTEKQAVAMAQFVSELVKQCVVWECEDKTEGWVIILTGGY